MEKKINISSMNSLTRVSKDESNDIRRQLSVLVENYFTEHERIGKYYVTKNYMGKDINNKYPDIYCCYEKDNVDFFEYIESNIPKNVYVIGRCYDFINDVMGTVSFVWYDNKMNVMTRQIHQENCSVCPQ